MKTFGMQLSKTDALIDTRLFLGLSADKFKPEVLEDAELEQMYREKLQNGTTDGLSETERFIARELNDNELLAFFPGTNQMMYRVEIKNEKLHGIYEEFYRNGQLKIKGKYRKGLKSGRWIYYSPEGRENRIERY
jgi:antitoxin component YwqK of YwqJK toxin-antitoxin module